MYIYIYIYIYIYTYLYRVLEEIAVGLVGEGKPQDFANQFWGFVKIGRKPVLSLLA
jgi:hypothetical protein